MDFLKRLFGGGAQSGDPVGMYYYVRPHGCEEIVRVRIDRNNDLSLNDDGTFWVHKVVRGSKCRQQVEMDLYFDSSRRFREANLTHGDLVGEAEYQAWLEAGAKPAP